MTGFFREARETLHEPPSLFDGLQVERDDARLRVVRHVVDEIDFPETSTRFPGFRGPCDPDPFVGGQIDEARHERAPLWGDDGNGPSPPRWIRSRERRACRCPSRANKPQAVGADDAHPILPGDRADVIFQPCAFLPDSENPAETMIAWRIPAAACSRRIAGTVGAGVAMMESSGFAGRLRTEGQQERRPPSRAAG